MTAVNLPVGQAQAVARSECSISASRRPTFEDRAAVVGAFVLGLVPWVGLVAVIGFIGGMPL